MLKRKQRVRVHLIDDNLPSIEGLLVARRPELVLAVPQLIHAPDSPPAVLESKLLAIPRERVAFWEVL